MPPAPSPSQARYRPEMVATVERRLSDLALDAHASSATGRVLPLGETDFPPAPAVRTVSLAALAQGRDVTDMVWVSVEGRFDRGFLLRLRI